MSLVKCKIWHFSSQASTSQKDKTLLIVCRSIPYHLPQPNILKNNRIKACHLIEQKYCTNSQSSLPEVSLVILGDGTAKRLLSEGRCAQLWMMMPQLPLTEQIRKISSPHVPESLGIHRHIKVNRQLSCEDYRYAQTTTIVTPKSIAVDTVMHLVRRRYNVKAL